MTNELTIYQIDAFAERPFAGNPAGVVVTETPLPAELMQAVAAEMNLSETAFLLPRNTGYAIRYFTPLKEVPLCGHATLASAHLLRESGRCDGAAEVALMAPAGELVARYTDAGIALDFPEYSLESSPVPEGFAEAVGFTPRAVMSSNYGWILAEAPDQAAVAAARPRFGELEGRGLGHLMITAAGESDSGADYVCRCFAPVAGIDEDPVTGSAQCALAPYWYARTGKRDFEVRQLSRRGGRLGVSLRGGGRVEIRGRAVTVFRAEMRV